MNINSQIILKYSQPPEIKGYLQIKLKPTFLDGAIFMPIEGTLLLNRNSLLPEDRRAAWLQG